MPCLLFDVGFALCRFSQIIMQRSMMTLDKAGRWCLSPKPVYYSLLNRFIIESVLFNSIKKLASRPVLVSSTIKSSIIRNLLQFSCTSIFRRFFWCLTSCYNWPHSDAKFFTYKRNGLKQPKYLTISCGLLLTDEVFLSFSWFVEFIYVSCQCHSILLGRHMRP